MSNRSVGRGPFGLARTAAALPLLATLALAGAALVGATQGSSQGAFAAAARGNYAIVILASQTSDSILAISLEEPGDRYEIASVSHLPGHASTGSVSPDGSHVALVVADSGLVSSPRASLVLVELATGDATLVAGGLDPLQRPPWTSDGSTVAVTSTQPAQHGSNATVYIAGIDGTLEETAVFSGVLGIYPFSFSPDGVPWLSVIDRTGSTLYLGQESRVSLGPYITRDWVLSPDALSVAYVEANTDSGVQYLPRVVTTNPNFGHLETSISTGQALGTAWHPSAISPTFGVDPSTALTSGGGFDVPLAFAADGSALAVQHWTGGSYKQPGEVQLQAITASGRIALEPATRFLGWSAR